MARGIPTMRLLAGFTLALLAACSGRDPEPYFSPGPVLAWSQPTGPTRGGRGLSGRGGDAGQVFLSSLAEIVFQEAIPAGVPAAPAPSVLDLGANPRTITTETTLGGTVLGDDGAHLATGLWVKAGATLRLSAVAGLPGLARINVGGPIRVDGAVRIAPGVSATGRTLALAGSGLQVGPQGVIDGSGGADAEAAALELQSGADGLRVEGALLARGRDGAGQGDGGTVRILAGLGPVTLVGQIDASGGRSALARARLGGGALVIDPADGASADVHLGGTIDLVGGPGGPGGWVTVRAGGTVVFSGLLDTHGGDGGAWGGPGGYVSLSGARTWIVGDLVTRGGDGGEWAGPGGGLSAFGLVLLAGQLDLSGGEGLDGGAGGEIVVNASSNSLPLVVAGRTSFRGEGGDGTGPGGGGARMILQAPIVRLEIPIELPGGVSTRGGPGGTGGRLQVSGGEVSCGAASAGGGAASDTGGAGGSIQLQGTGSLRVSGALRVTGGEGGAVPGIHGLVLLNTSQAPLSGGVYTP